MSVPHSSLQALIGRERRDRAPGDLLEVWAEKLVGAGHTALGLVSQLKRGALLSDFESLIKRCGEVVVLADFLPGVLWPCIYPHTLSALN